MRQPPHGLARAFRPSLIGLLALLACVAAGVGAAVPALAQTAEMSLPALTQDRGLRSGEFTLHPALGVMGHHDTNVFNGNDKETGNPPKGATSIRILPRLSLLNDASGNVNFTFSGNGDIRIYPGTDNAAIKELTAVGGNLALDLKFGQRRSFSFAVFDYLGRSLRANNWETTATLNRFSNDLGARVEFHPGDIPERRPFSLSFAASYAFDKFEAFGAGDSSTVRTRLSGSWKFLPKTAAILDTTWDFRSFDVQDLAKLGLSHDSKPFRFRAGLSGALSKRVSTQALVGWGLSAHSSGSSFNGLIASAGVGLRASDSTRLYVGYDRDFAVSFFANYSSFHRGYFSLKQRFGQVLDVVGTFGVRAMTYGALTQSQPGIAVTGLTSCTGGACRRDTALEGSLAANFELARLMSLNIGYNLRSVQTNFTIRAGSTSGTILDAGAFTAHELFATLFLRY